MKNLSENYELNNSNVILPAVKLYVGQKLWLVRSSLHRNDDIIPKEVTISKVGKKYFKLEDYPRTKFEIETLRQVTEGSYVDKCYLTLQEILDAREFNKLVCDIKKIFDGYGKPKLTLEQLRKIMDVIGVKQEQ